MKQRESLHGEEGHRLREAALPGGSGHPGAAGGPGAGSAGRQHHGVLLKQAAGLAKASGEPNKNKVGKVTRAQVEEIAKTKMPDLNANDLEAAVAIVKGSARSMGIEVEG